MNTHLDRFSQSTQEVTISGLISVAEAAQVLSELCSEGTKIHYFGTGIADEVYTPEPLWLITDNLARQKRGLQFEADWGYKFYSQDKSILNNFANLVMSLGIEQEYLLSMSFPEALDCVAKSLSSLATNDLIIFAVPVDSKGKYCVNNRGAFTITDCELMMVRKLIQAGKIDPNRVIFIPEKIPDHRNAHLFKPMPRDEELHNRLVEMENEITIMGEASGRIQSKINELSLKYRIHFPRGEDLFPKSELLGLNELDIDDVVFAKLVVYLGFQIEKDFSIAAKVCETNLPTLDIAMICASLRIDIFQLFKLMQRDVISFVERLVGEI